MHFISRVYLRLYYLSVRWCPCSGFMSRFTRFVMNPTNPFMAGASVLGSVVAAQSAYLQVSNPLICPESIRTLL